MRGINYGRTSIYCALALALGITAAPAGAQSGDDEIGFEEVVVTAQRREQSLQEVPIAVSAFSRGQLAEYQITEALDLARVVPNMIAHNNTGLGSGNTYSIRGLNNTESIATFDPPVGSYIDDIYITRQNANNFSLFDVERVEVLRGPQGTLFGRNTTGGAINVILQKPQEEQGGRFELSYGNYSRLTASASVDVPVSDRFFTKFSAYYVEDDGFVDNRTTGENDFNFEESYGLRGAFRWLASDTITWDASIAYLDSDHANVLNFEDGDDRITNTGFRQDGNLNGILVGEKAGFGQGNVTETLIITSDVTVDVAWGALSFITGYISLDQDFSLDFFDGPLPSGGFTIANQGEHDSFTQEIKLVGSTDDGKIDYVAGFYYLDEDNTTDFGDVFTLDIGTPTGLPLVLADRVLDNTTEAFAFYGQFDYHMNEKWTFTLGARYTDEEKDIAYRANPNPNAGPGFNTGDIQALGIPTSQDESIVTPRVAAQYNFSDDINGYVSATRGFKSGGWNARGTSAGTIQPFDPEKVWSYELGLRADWSRTFRSNITAFMTDVEDFQLPSAFEDPATGAIQFITQNFADLDIEGIELEFVWTPTPALNTFLNIGYQDAEYTSIDPSILAQQQACLGGDAGSCGVGIVAPNGSIAEPVRSPDYTVTVGATYDGDIGDYMLRPSLIWSSVGDQWTGTSNTPESFSESYDVITAGLTFEPKNGNWSVTAECDNCTDETYVVSALGGFAYIDDPRTYRVRFNYSF
ncbi:MAG: TonB-dependent receptor [Pseudomonadota bacterium]